MQRYKKFSKNKNLYFVFTLNPLIIIKFNSKKDILEQKKYNKTDS